MVNSENLNSRISWRNMHNLRKNAQSSILIVVISIVLVLVLIGIVWLAYKLLIEQGREQMEINAMQANFEIQDVYAYVHKDPDTLVKTPMLNVTVYRGLGEVDVPKLIFLLKDDADKTYQYELIFEPGKEQKEQETKNYLLRCDWIRPEINCNAADALEKIIKVSVAYTGVISSGKNVTKPIVDEVVNSTAPPDSTGGRRDDFGRHTGGGGGGGSGSGPGENPGCTPELATTTCAGRICGIITNAATCSQDVSCADASWTEQVKNEVDAGQLVCDSKGVYKNSGAGIECTAVLARGAYFKDYVYFEEAVYWDECKDESTVKEYSCASDALVSTEINCQNGCLSGVCKCAAPECILGERGCDDSLPYVCVKDSNGCLKKQIGTECAAGCTNGVCNNCVNECNLGEEGCTVNTPYTCVQDLATGCFKKQAASQACPETCSNGECLCTNQCSAEGLTCGVGGGTAYNCVKVGNCFKQQSIQNCPNGCTNGVCNILPGEYQDVSSCEALGIPNKAYRLTQDITLPAIGKCLEIQSSGITLDCQEHSISIASKFSDEVTPYSGIYVGPSGTGATIKNCVVSMARGVGSINSNGIWVSQIMNAYGIWLDNAEDVTIIDNKFIRNSRGVNINEGDNHVIKNNNFTTNQYGVMADLIANLEISNNKLTNDYTSIKLANCDVKTSGVIAIKKNNISSDEDNGIEITNSYGGGQRFLVSENNVTKIRSGMMATYAGIRLWGNQYLAILKNNITYSRRGIVMSLNGDSLIEANTASYNSENGAVISGGGSAGNTFKNNNFSLNPGNGIYFSGGSNNVFNNNFACNNGGKDFTCVSALVIIQGSGNYFTNIQKCSEPLWWMTGTSTCPA